MKDSEKSKQQLIKELEELRVVNELQLTTSNDFLGSILNELPIGVAVLDGKDFTYSHINKFLAKFNGKTVAEHIGKKVQDMVNKHSVSDVLSNLRQVRKSGKESSQRALSIPLANGEVRHLLDWHFPYKTDRIMVVVVDITEKKRLETQLLHSQQLESLGVLAGGIAHDFNNILAVIQGNSEMLMMKEAENDAVQHHVERIIRAGERASELINQILAYSRLDPRKYSAIDITGVIKEALTMVRSTVPSFIHIESNIPTDLGLILGSQIGIHQITVNLLINSYQSMRKKGGTITLNLKFCEEAPARSDLISGTIQGRCIELSITDTGAGIKQEDLGNIFNPFFTTKGIGQGTGLGLSMVHGIVKSHQGAIAVFTEINRGTTIKVYFPVIEKISGIKSFDGDKCNVEGGKGRLLIVDDEVEITDLYKEFFTSLGYKVTIFNDGKPAILAINSEPNKFDLVITDQAMPEVTGEILIKEIAKVAPDIPIIISTGHSSLFSKTAAIEAGASHYVRKPVKLHELSKIVSDCLDNN